MRTSSSIGSIFVRRFLWVLLCCGLAVTGCDRTPRSRIPRAELIVVRIVCEGKPLLVGDVNLNNFDTGEGGGGSLDSKGEVSIPRVALGEYTVTVTPPAPDGPDGKLPASARQFRVDRKYFTPETSPLKISVKKESTDFELEVTNRKK